MKYTCGYLQRVVTRSASFAEVMRIVGIHNSSGFAQSRIRDQVKKYGIDTSHFVRKKFHPPSTKIHWTGVLVRKNPDKRRTQTPQLRRAMIESGITYQCAECELLEEWNGKPIVLQIDHVDSDCLNDVKKNLRFLCPNCHSQTDGYGVVKNKEALRSSKFPKVSIQCDGCGAKMMARSNKVRGNRYCNRTCFLRNRKPPPTKIQWPTDEELQTKLKVTPVRTVARELGVSDNAVLKRCRKRGIETYPAGHWTAVRYP